MVVKRLFDLVLALATAVVLAVPVLLVALAVRLTSPGPAYLQRQSLAFDVRILWLTFVKVLRRDGVSH